jgi:hypothetical protein
VKDLVLGAKVDLKTCTILYSIIEIHGDFCYTKCGSGGSVVTVSAWLGRPVGRLQAQFVICGQQTGNSSKVEVIKKKEKRPQRTFLERLPFFYDTSSSSLSCRFRGRIRC